MGLFVLGFWRLPGAPCRRFMQGVGASRGNMKGGIAPPWRSWQLPGIRESDGGLRCHKTMMMSLLRVVLRDFKGTKRTSVTGVAIWEHLWLARAWKQDDDV